MSTVVRLSEVFRSIQGEGSTIGRNTIWIRVWGCDLSCRGFSQPDPTDPSTYINPWKDVDFSKTLKLEDLPVLDRGCDSAYSHEKEFMKLSKKYTLDQLYVEMQKLVANQDGSFAGVDLCFTGGEPLMQQHNIVAILDYLVQKGNIPRGITFETNGRWAVTEDLFNSLKRIEQTWWNTQPGSFKMLFSVSPKLFTVSGEKDAVDYATLLSLIEDAENECWDLQLKFVVTNHANCIYGELPATIGTLASYLIEASKTKINPLNEKSVHVSGEMPPIFLMPVGGTEEQQSSDSTREMIEELIDRGYDISIRAHNFIWKNSVGR